MRMKRTLIAVGSTAVVVVGLTIAGMGFANAAGQRPPFQLPFPCGQTWNGDSDNSSAHRAFEIDFNRGSTADADLGDSVVAAAAGKVITSSHQGSANGYGNLVVIDHGGGWRSFYAHLRVRAVGVGANVSRGQKIGELGNTSKPGNNISPHLHFEIRTTDAAYPASIQPAFFNGVRFGYPNQTLRSNNGCSGSANPHTPTGVCGAGYDVIDQAPLGSGGSVYLLYNADKGDNCVVTIKAGTTVQATSAYLEVQGRTRVTDSGSFAFYAGPVRASAPNTCVKWGGSVGTATYNSPFEHCD
jgi:hypothetical protein